ncbi:hypothetical protein JOB18_038490, partial [Solea senegalensis]
SWTLSTGSQTVVDSEISTIYALRGALNMMKTEPDSSRATSKYIMSLSAVSFGPALTLVTMIAFLHEINEHSSSFAHERVSRASFSFLYYGVIDHCYRLACSLLRYHLCLLFCL